MWWPHHRLKSSQEHCGTIVRLQISKQKEVLRPAKKKRKGSKTKEDNDEVDGDIPREIIRATIILDKGDVVRSLGSSVSHFTHLRQVVVDDRAQITPLAGSWGHLEFHH